MILDIFFRHHMQSQCQWAVPAAAQRRHHGRHAASHRRLPPHRQGPALPQAHQPQVRRQGHRHCAQRIRGCSCGSAGDAVHPGAGGAAVGGGVQRAGAWLGAAARARELTVSDARGGVALAAAGVRSVGRMPISSRCPISRCLRAGRWRRRAWAAPPSGLRRARW